MGGSGRLVRKHTLIQGRIKQRPLILAQPKKTPYPWQANNGLYC